MNSVAQDNAMFSLCALVIHVRPEAMNDIASKIRQIEGVEIHPATDSSKMVVTVESIEGDDIIFSAIDRINSFKGVIATNISYTHSEPMTS